MKIYLVGGAVRDKLLGINSIDKDWVVVGAEPKDLLDLGYVQVGQMFPVFLHPKTKEEYALARTESKSGHGYKGFICDFNPTITLEEDLSRRDLTINAMAMDSEQNIIDPYGGALDLQNKTLRHVSAAFNEDPVRVLRVARFLAKFAHLGFSIDPKTLALMAQMAHDGELDYLTRERIGSETLKALETKSPAMYFKALINADAFLIIFSPLKPLLQKCLLANLSFDALTHSANHTDDIDIRLTALCFCIIKANNQSEIEQNQFELVKSFCQFLNINSKSIKFILLCLTFYNEIDHNKMTYESLIHLFNASASWKQPEVLDKILSCYLLITEKSLQGLDKNHQVISVKKSYEIASKLTAQQIMALGYKGAEIQQTLNQKRAEAIKQYFANCFLFNQSN